MDGFSCSSCFGWLFLNLAPDPVRNTFSAQESRTEATKFKQISSLPRRSSQWHPAAEVVGKKLHVLHSLFLGLVSRQFYVDDRPNNSAWPAASRYGMAVRSGICIALRERALCSKLNPTSQVKPMAPGREAVGKIRMYS